MNQFYNPILNYFNKIKIKLPVKKLKQGSEKYLQFKL